MTVPTDSPLVRLATTVMSELVTVVGMLVGEELSCDTTTDAGGADWTARIEVVGTIEGTLTVGMANDAVVGLAGRILGLDTVPPADDVADAFQEAFNQVVGSLNQSTPESGVTATLAAFEQAPPPTGAPLVVFELTAGGEPRLGVACWGSVTEQAQPAAEPPPAPAAATGGPPSRNLDILLDIELPFSVRFGKVDMSIADLSRLGPGAVVSLGRLPDDPVEVLINGKMVAHGEVVVVAGNYGVRILDVASREDRIRSMGD